MSPPLRRPSHDAPPVPLPTLGVDPGHDGGAVLLDASGRNALGAWSWRRHRRKGRGIYVLRAVSARGCAEFTPRNLHGVGLQISRSIGGRLALCCEGISLHRRAAPSTAIELGRTVGLLTGPLLGRPETVEDLPEGAVVVLDEPLASSWRPTILGLPGNASSDDSEAAARALCVSMGWSEQLGRLLDDGHACEAACIARWGWVQQRQGAAGRG